MTHISRNYNAYLAAPNLQQPD